MIIGIVGHAPEIEMQLRHIVASGSFSVPYDQMPRTLAELSTVLAANEFPDILILVPAGDPRSALPLTRTLSTEQRTGLVVVTDRPEPDFAIEAYRAGASDVISKETNLEELRGAISRAAQISQRAAVAAAPAVPVEQAERGVVIAVGSATGGVGKSMAAVNIAVGISGVDPGKTALVDVAPQFGGATDLLDGMIPLHTLPSIVSASDSIAAKTYLSYHDKSGLYVAPADEDPSTGDQLDPAEVARTVEMLVHQFRTVIVDTAAGLIPTNLEVFSRADELLVVSDFSVHSLRATRTYLGLLERVPRRLPLTVKVLLNRFDKSAGLTRKHAEEILGVPADAVLDEQPLLLNACNRGEPPMLAPASNQLRQELSPLVGLFHEHHVDPKRANRWFK